MNAFSDFDRFAHDLRSYLRDIILRAQSALRSEGEALGPEHQDALNRIVDSGTTCDQLIRAMSTYLDVNAQRDVCTSGRGLIRAAELATADLFAAGQANYSRSVELNPAFSIPISLESVVVELIRNAVKFGGTLVQLTASSADDYLTIDVRDDGIGIHADYHQQIFQPFHRLHPRGVYPGFGLGLATAAKTLQQLGGTISLRESQPELGSLFRVTLPPASFAVSDPPRSSTIFV